MQNGQPSPPINLTDTSVMLVLRIGRLGNRRKVPTALVTVDADPDAVHVGKELLESPELKAIQSEDDEIRRWIYGRSLPSFGTLRDGVYRVPLALVDDVDEELEAFRQRRQVLIDKFLERYPAMVNEAVARLGLEFCEGQRHYKWYGRYMGGSELPEGFGVNDLGKSTHTIRVPGADYEIGVQSWKDGSYKLLFDSWGPGGLVQALGPDLNRLKQSYGIAAAILEAQRQGYSIWEEQLEDGATKLHVRIGG